MSNSNSRTTSTYRVELFVRSLAPTGATDQQSAAIADLERLEEEGVIETYSVTVWGNRICPETAEATDFGRSLLEKVDRFRRWGRDNGVSLEPYFQRREIRSMVDEPYAAIVPPLMCLAVYDDAGELWGVFPCLKDEERCSIFDCLQSFEESDAVPGSPSDVRAERLQPSAGRENGP